MRPDGPLEAGGPLLVSCQSHPEGQGSGSLALDVTWLWTCRRDMHNKNVPIIPCVKVGDEFSSWSNKRAPASSEGRAAASPQSRT